MHCERKQKTGVVAGAEAVAEAGAAEEAAEEAEALTGGIGPRDTIPHNKLHLGQRRIKQQPVVEGVFARVNKQVAAPMEGFRLFHIDKLFQIMFNL
jgi:hypothetical protein